jgi:type II secretory pathway pseudopilin PulG
MLARHDHNTRKTGARAPAFTLLEAIIVMVIMGVLAGMIVPRVLNVGQRQAELEAKAVRSLLSVAAEKADTMNRSVAIDYVDATSGPQGHGPRLTIWVQRQDAKAASDTVGAARVTWVQDPLSDMVELTRLKIAQATSDGAVLASGKWRVAFTPGQPRPPVELRLEPIASGDGPTWVVSLAPDDTEAVLGTPDGVRGVVASQSRTIDLDDTGKGDAKW